MAGIQPAISSFDWQNINPVKPVDTPARVRETARQFESVLMGLLLKSMREASGAEGWLGTGEDQSLSNIAELAEQQVAQALSASGGLGLAKLVEAGLNRTRVEAGGAPSAKPGD